ncbi:glycosyltransferase family 2 protein [Alsobacter sp. R-9]
MLSVIVPVYNKAPFVRRCVASIKGQTIHDFEVVVVDDGSTDGSVEVIREAIADDPRFTVIVQPNGGVSRARNTGCSAAKGTWFVLLDADDEWLPDHLERIQILVSAHPQAGLVATGYEIVGRDEVRFQTTAFDSGPNPFDYCAAWERMGETPISASSVALRRDALEAVGGFPDGVSLGEDVLTWLEVLRRSPGYFANELTVRVHHDDVLSLTRKPSPGMIAGHEWFLEQLDRLRKDDACSDYLIRRYALIHCYLLIRTEQRRDLMKFVLKRLADLDLRSIAVSLLEVVGLRRGLMKLAGKAG